MTGTDRSKRTFFKKMTAAVGFVSAAAYLGNLISARSNPIERINENCANDVKLQRKVLQQKQLVLMSENDKKQLLDELLNIDGKSKIEIL